MGFNLKNPRNGKKPVKNVKMANFEAIKNICMVKVVGEQGLALQERFLARGLKLCHFAIFDMVFPYFAFFKL